MLREEYNSERPLIMHIDLNSCFATVEQQSRPLLRGRPVAIANRRTEKTSIVTASYEAKARGVTMGMKVYEAQRLVPELVVLESDPSKYRYVYRKLLAIMQDYSAHVRMKSIDEGIIDFHDAPEIVRNRDMEEIGQEIKTRLRVEIGDYMRCNIGIASNRFLAKTAAGLHKPDGMDVIAADNLRQTLEGLKLQDLTGIAHRNERRLNMVGIDSPIEFLDASVETLRDVVFKSVVGEWWHQRLRGWEVDDKDFPVRRVGRQYVLERNGLRFDQIIQRLHHLCESVGERLRGQGLAARGVYVYAKTKDRYYWHRSYVTTLPFYSNQAIFNLAQTLFQPPSGSIKEIGVHCYKLEPYVENQLSLFGDELAKEQSITQLTDSINARFGERTIHAASTLGTGIYVKQKIPFGSTRYL